MSQPNRIATALLAISVLIATLSFPIRSAAMEDWEADARADQYANAISIENGWSGRFTTEPFNNAPYIAAWGIAALLLGVLRHHLRRGPEQAGVRQWHDAPAHAPSPPAPH